MYTTTHFCKCSLWHLATLANTCILHDFKVSITLINSFKLFQSTHKSRALYNTGHPHICTNTSHMQNPIIIITTSVNVSSEVTRQVIKTSESAGLQDANPTIRPYATPPPPPVSNAHRASCVIPNPVTSLAARRRRCHPSAARKCARPPVLQAAAA